MITTKVIRIGKFELVDVNKYSDNLISATCEIFGKKAEMIFREGWQTVDVKEWKFITGDKATDAIAKRQFDFDAFTILDIAVDTEEIIREAANWFSYAAEKRKVEQEHKEKNDRAKIYENHFLLNVVKPELIGEKMEVGVSISKEDFINGKGSISLVINGSFAIREEFNNQLLISNLRIHPDGIRKTTRAKNIKTIIKIVKEVMTADKYLMESKRKKIENLKGAKENLEAALGIEMACKKQWHSGNTYGRVRNSNNGYETEYFVDAKYKDEYSGGIRFVEGHKENVKGFTIQNIPVITDMEKLKKIYELLA